MRHHARRTGTFSSALRLAWVFIFASGTAQAVCTYDAASDWAPVLDVSPPVGGYANPTGQWSVGYTDDPTIVANFDQFTSSSQGFAGGFNCLTSGTLYPFFCLWNGAVPSYGTDPGQLALHPGEGPLAYSVLRFTVPTAGIYDINAQFFRGELPDGQTLAYVFIDGNPFLSGSQTPVTSQGQVFANQVIDFVVGPGTDGISTDTTPIDVTVHEVGCGK